MFAQWDYGSCDKGRKRNIQPNVDTPENREEWFCKCLVAIGSLKHQKIAFPFKIGCGLAGGNWKVYFKMIKEFSWKYNKHVTIIVPRPDLQKRPTSYHN